MKDGLIKEAKPFGKYNSHISMSAKDKGKKFIVLPIKYRFMLNDLVKKIDKALKKPLSEILTDKEIDYIRKAIAEQIEKPVTNFNKSILNKAYKDYYENLETLNDTNDLKNIIHILHLSKNPNKIIIRKIIDSKGYTGGSEFFL